MKNHRYLHLPCASWQKGNTKVCEVDSDNDSDDELDPYEFTNLINEYTSVIKREKGKVKVLESTHAKLELAHSSGFFSLQDASTQHRLVVRFRQHVLHVHALYI